MSQALVERSTAASPLLIERPDLMWEFKGETFEDHLTCWQEIAAEVERDLWMLGAVASSLVKKHKENTISNFAHEVRLSARRVREIAQTYEAFQNGERSPILSFHHHTIAARAKEPVEAIHKAEDKEWSTRELETWVQTGLEPGEKVEVNAKKVSDAADSVRAVSRKALSDHIQEALDMIAALKLKCPSAKFVSDVYDEWETDLRDYISTMALEDLKDKVVSVWKAGNKKESDIARATGIPESEIHGVMRTYEREGLFERHGATKTEKGRGMSRWVWHLKGEPIFD